MNCWLWSKLEIAEFEVAIIKAVTFFNHAASMFVRGNTNVTLRAFKALNRLALSSYPSYAPMTTFSILHAPTNYFKQQHRNITLIITGEEDEGEADVLFDEFAELADRMGAEDYPRYRKVKTSIE